MIKRSWAELPTDVREAIEIRCGGVDAVVDAPVGTAYDFAGILVTPTGPIFCKVVRSRAPQAWMLRNELRVNPWLPSGSAPQALWHLTADAWLAVAFEHVEGRHADLSPGSPDLEAIATALDRISACDVTDWPIRVHPIQRRWRTVGDLDDLGNADAYAGSALLHADPAPSNLLVTPAGSVTLVDWAWPARGAPWIDAALLVTHLIRHGHHPAEAEHWAATTTAWPSADPTHIDAFAATLSALRTHQAQTHPAPHHPLAAAAATTWLAHRRSSRGPRRRP